MSPHGHDIELNVALVKARIEDLLMLGVKTYPPIMSGNGPDETKFSLPPGAADISDGSDLRDLPHSADGYFSNEKVQTRIDRLSLRGLGKPKLLQDAAQITVPSDLTGTFTLHTACLSFSSLHFEIPGTHADMNGQYSLDGNTFDFHGQLKIDAKLSQMTTGWKSILLKPVDPFFREARSRYGDSFQDHRHARRASLWHRLPPQNRKLHRRPLTHMPRAAAQQNWANWQHGRNANTASGVLFRASLKTYVFKVSPARASCAGIQ